MLFDKRKKRNQNKILEIIFDSDEVSWRELLFSVIKKEDMNPWDIDVSEIADKFLEMLKTLQEFNLRLTGKVVLASAILLKLKSDRLMEEDMDALNQLISSTEDEIVIWDDFPTEYPEEESEEEETPELVPKTPQPRKRKVSVYDLVDALEKALEVEKRREFFEKEMPEEEMERVEPPEDTVDISVVMKDIYSQINSYYKEKKESETLTFNRLLEKKEKEDKVMKFIPLLHLDHQRKVDLKQEEVFSDINIHLLEEDSNFSEEELKV